MTAVEDPIEALEASFAVNSQKSVSLTNDGDLSEKVDAAGSEKLLFVYFDDNDGNEDFAKHGEATRLHNFNHVMLILQIPQMS